VFAASGAIAEEANPAANGAIAKVGAQTITRGALTTHLMKYYARNGLEQLIDRSVIRQEAARLSASVSEPDLEARAAEVKRGLGDFEAALKQQGVSEETWREGVRYGLLAEKVLDKKWPVKDTDLTRLMVRYARVNTRDQARKIITDAKNGVSFELLAAQQSIDGRENRGLVAEKPFLRVERPAFFKLATDAGLRVGQVTPQPIASKEYWLVLKLEGVFGPETLRGREREDAIRRIRAYRMASLLPTPAGATSWSSPSR
jgi:foldase protein PrsA